MPISCDCAPLSRVGKLLLMMLLAILAGCDGDNADRSPQSLIFADLSQAMGGILYVAQARGYLDEENLTIETIELTSGRDAMNKMVSGEAEVGIAVDFAILKSLQKGNDLRLISTVFRTNAYSGIVARTDRGVKSVRNLKGKRVGITFGTAKDYMLSFMLSQAGLSDDDVERVPVAPTDMADALEKGDVDAVATWSPHLSNAQARFGETETILLRTSAYLDQAVLLATEKTVREKSDALHRLVRAIARAEDYIYQNPSEALQIVVERLALSPAARTALNQAWPHYQFQARLDNLLMTSLRNQYAWLNRNSGGPEEELNLDDYVYVAPLAAIRALSVTIDQR